MPSRSHQLSARSAYRPDQPQFIEDSSSFVRPWFCQMLQQGRDPQQPVVPVYFQGRLLQFLAGLHVSMMAPMPPEIEATKLTPTQKDAAFLQIPNPGFGHVQLV